jgi:hypothetical protein
LSEEVKNKFYCSSQNSCIGCSKQKVCSSYAAKDCRQFLHKREKELNHRFLCSEMGGFCKKECSKFNYCKKPEKENFLKWKNAYKNNNKELLKKIIKQGGK